MDRWVVAMVKDGAELALAASLSADLGIEAYTPAHRRWRKLAKHVARREGRTRELVVDALLTGYLFAKVNMTDNRDIARLLEVKGVYGLIGTSRGPCFAREQDVEAMRLLEASGVHDVKVRASDVRKPAASVTEELRKRLHAMSLIDLVGKVVCIIEGPFKGLCADVQDVRNGFARLSTPNVSIEAPLSALTVS